MKKTILLTAIPFLFLSLLSFITVVQQEPWNVPDKYNKLVNPVKSSPETVALGKSLWMVHCKSCHGAAGKGDGPKIAQLGIDCSDFSTPEFQKQSDGALYYKTNEGRDYMPSFKKKIPGENEIWALVNYMRTLK